MNVTDLVSYFNAEKAESLLFVLVGIMAIAVVIFALFVMRTSVWKGTAFPLLFIAFIQLVVGGTVYFRTDDQVNELVRLYQKNKPQFVQQELDRMETVNANFNIYKLIEVTLILVSLLLFFAMRHTNQFWYGFGIGLFIQSGLMLAFDFFAEGRADVYIAFLKQL